MRAIVELNAGEKQALRTLTGEERDAVIDQMLERVREDLEWLMAMEHARGASAEPARTIPAAPRRSPPPMPRRRSFAR